MNFKVGDRIRNIDPRTSDKRGANYGEYGEVTDVDDGIVYVEYDNGDEGNSAKPEKYYQIIEKADNACRPCKEEYAPRTNTKTMSVIQSAVRAVKRFAMSATERNLIDAGLKDECGVYTDTAKELLLQTMGDTDVASTNSVLVAASNAILAERKAQKDNN